MDARGPRRDEREALAVSGACAAAEGHAEIARILCSRGADREAPDRNGINALLAASRGGRVEAAEATVRWNAGSATVLAPECTTTMRALDDWPWKFLSTSWRACTDCEPVASHPAPERAVSTRGAKKPKPTAMTTQAITTPLKCVAVKWPRRPIGPTRRASCPASA